MAKKTYQGAYVVPYTTAQGLRWRVRWREQGRCLSKTFATEPDAKHFAKQVGVALQVHSLVRDHTVEPGDLTETLARYIELLRGRGRSGSCHATNVLTAITRWQKQFSWEVTTDIDETALDGVVYALGPHRSTARKTVIAIKSFLRWVRRQHLAIDPDVLDFLTPKHAPAESVAWTEDEVALLLQECSRSNRAEVIPSGIGMGRGSQQVIERMVATRHWKIRRCLLPMLQLMVRYGPRPVEVTRLRVSDWRSRTASLHMPGTITKNGHPRTFIVDGETARWLDAAASSRDPWDLALDAVHTRRPGTDPLFRHRNGRGWRVDNLRQGLESQIQKAGIRGTPYTLRHTACTRLCRLAKGDLAVVQSITGHRTLSQLQTYLHITADRQRVIADAYVNSSMPHASALPLSSAVLPQSQSV